MQGRRAVAALEKVFRRATARARPLPSALVIGAQRAGTTTLHHWLARHPGVATACEKEVHFFDLHYARGLDWYRSRFSLGVRVAGRTVIESTPAYLLAPRAPERVARDLPDARFIVLLRDPVARAWSSWRHAKRLGLEPLPFDEAIAREDERTAAAAALAAAGAGREAGPFWTFSYARRGRYAEQLERWFRCFPRERFLVTDAEVMWRDPVAGLDAVADFLGVERRPTPALRARNVAPSSGPPPAATVQALREHFAPWDERLAARLGRRLDWMAG